MLCRLNSAASERPAHGRRKSGLELRNPAMQDVVMLLFTVVFFAMAFLYVKACQKLR